MHRPLLLAAVVGLAACPAPAGAATACVPEGEIVVARSAAVVVTEERHVVGEGVHPGFPDTDSVWRACLRDSGRRIELERGFSRYKSSRTADRFDVAGVHVLYVFSEGDYGGYLESVVKVDVSTGERADLAWSVNEFDLLALHRSGAAAWTRVTSGRFARVLGGYTAAGTPRTLDRVRRARHLTRLRFDARGTLRWRHRGRPRAARLG